MPIIRFPFRLDRIPKSAGRLQRLLRRFRLELPWGHAVLPRAVVTTQPDRPVRFRVVPRRAA